MSFTAEEWEAIIKTRPSPREHLEIEIRFRKIWNNTDTNSFEKQTKLAKFFHDEYQDFLIEIYQKRLKMNTL